MRLRADHNRRSARLSAAFIAALYVFLSTFGALTHSHAVPGQALEAVVETASSAQLPQSHASTISQPAAQAPCHCAFCDWQATSVDVPTFPPAIQPPLPAALPAAETITALRSIFLPHSCSRAPPQA